MSYQIFNESACIRIQLTNAPNDVKTLMVVKEQIKTVDIIKSNIVRLDIGEGALKNIYLNYQDVTFPTVTSADQLRDHIISLLKSDINDGDYPREDTLQEILGMLLNNYNQLKGIKAQGEDLSRLEPIFVDESNPNVIYKGWSSNIDDPASSLWAIQRISRVGDVVIYEWADGNQFYDNVWDNRVQLQYSPYLSDHFPVM